MTTVDTMTQHLADETLAAFADGRLRGGERDEVISHLAECDDCRAIFDLVGDAQQEEVIETERHPVVVQGSFGRRAGMAGLAAAAALVVVISLPASRQWIDLKRTGGVSDLVEATDALPERLVEARISGFSHKPMKPNMRGPGDEDAPDFPRMQVDLAADEILARKGDSVTALRAQGLSQLIKGEHDQAIETLRRAVEKRGDDPVLLNDLAAAYLERSRFTSNKADAANALRAAERSWEIERSPEAAWNRALAMEYQRRNDDAIRAWRDFIALDPQSPWAAEARHEHIDKLRDPR